MSTEEIDRVIAGAQSVFPRVRVTGGATTEEIKQLELMVGANIPASYRYFLSEYGTLGFYGLEVYGLVAGNIFGEGPPSAYFMTQSDLDAGTIPIGNIVVNSTGYGPVFLLNCRNGNVFGWNYTGEIDDELPSYSTFELFLEDVVSQTLADYKAKNS
jgi:hypothetical protein